MEKIQEKHLREVTETRGHGYIDGAQINQELSYYIESKIYVNGERYLYQFITMTDGTVYELSSVSNTTNGIVANNCKHKNVLKKEIRRLTKDAIPY